MAPLTSDRHAPLRAAAAAGLAAVHARADARVLLWHLASLSSADAALFSRVASRVLDEERAKNHAWAELDEDGNGPQQEVGRHACAAACSSAAACSW